MYYLRHMTRPAPALIETIRVRQGTIPLLPLHERRLRASCLALGLPVQALKLPEGGPDRVVRLEVGPAGATLSTRDVGATTPVRLQTVSAVHEAYRHKTTQRDQFDRAAAEARAVGADDGLMLTGEGLVAEAAIWCLYWWEEDRIQAPDLDLGVLPGVSRARIEQIAGPLASRRVGREALAGRSLFVSNAVRGVVPVAELDGRPVPVHPRTAVLAERFWP